MGGSNVGGTPGLGQQQAGQGASSQAGNPQQQLGQMPQWVGQLGGQTPAAGAPQGQLPSWLTQPAAGGSMSGGVGNLIQALMQQQSGAGNPLSQFMGSAWEQTPAQTPAQPTGNNMFSQLFARRTQ